MLVGRRVEHEARILSRPRGEHHDFRLLHLALLLLVVVFDAGDPGALLIGEHPSDGRARPHFGASLPCIAEIGDDRIGERPGRTADMAPAVVDAGRPPLVFGRVHSDRRRDHADADRFESLEPDLTVAEGPHRRHRIGLASRPPDLLRLGVARHADVARDPVVIGREILVGDWPVERAAVLTLDLEVVRQEAREVGEVVERRSANPPARLTAVAVGVPAFEQERSARCPKPPSPEIRADQIGELPVRSLFEHHDLLSRLRQHCGEDRARRAGADYSDIDFFVRSHDHHLFAGAICGM